MKQAILVGGIRISPREIECIYHLICGKTVKQIGRALKLSPRTVESYLENIKNKLDCNNRSQIIDKVFAVRFSLSSFIDMICELE